MRKSRKPKLDFASKRSDDIIERLDAYYRLGQQALKLGGSASGSYAPGVIAQLVSQTGESVATVTKCRKFAELYSITEFQALCKLRTPKGKPIGWGHVTKLLSVPDDKPRRTLQSRAAKEGWTARQLEREIRRSHGKRGSGGKKPTLPTSKREALRQIVTRSQQWLTWHEGLAGAENISLEDLAEDVHELLNRASRTIRKLESAVTKST